MEKIKIGISECLLGHKVRYDGTHTIDKYLVNTLGQYVEYVQVCPEVDCGLSTPREAMRLVGNPENPRLITNKTHQDMTQPMKDWAIKKVIELEKEKLCGFIFKSKSPSSGMERVKVYDEKGVPKKVGVGIFARMFMEHYPLIPVEEEGRLHDPKLRENFIEMIFILRKWRALNDEKSLKGLVQFHTQHKYTMMAHSVKHMEEMGRLVARQKSFKPENLYNKYEKLLVECLRIKTTTKKNTNVLEHIAGYFKKDISPDEKKEIAEIIKNYHSGHVPLIVPITLVKHYVRKYNQNYLLEQNYLNPHPIELQLRNHA